MVTKKKLFLACGADLAEERDAVELIIQRKNNDLIDKGLFLDVVRWEKMRQDFGNVRAQDHYSSDLENCDVIIVLFFKRVGKYTKEEFDIAYNRFKSGKNPRHLFVYFKRWLVPSDQIDSDILKVAELENRIKTDEQIFIKFKEIPELCLSVNTQIDLLIKEFEKEIGVIPVEFTSIEKEVLQLPININENKFDKNMVEDLARRCGLFTPWKENRHLTFESGDISYFTGMNFSPFELEVKFRARKLILEKADELGIRLDEPGDLSEKSKRVESLLIDYWKAKNK